MASVPTASLYRLTMPIHVRRLARISLGGSPASRTAVSMFTGSAECRKENVRVPESTTVHLIATQSHHQAIPDRPYTSIPSHTVTTNTGELSTRHAKVLCSSRVFPVAGTLFVPFRVPSVSPGVHIFICRSLKLFVRYLLPFCPISSWQFRCSKSKLRRHSERNGWRVLPT